MALKRINKELTDLGRYVYNILPLHILLAHLAPLCSIDAFWGFGSYTVSSIILPAPDSPKIRLPRWG